MLVNNREADEKFTGVPGLVALRWWAVLGQLSIFLIAVFCIDPQIAWTPIVGVLGIITLSNIWLKYTAHSCNSATFPLVGIILIFDTLLLTALLYCYGGYTNPLSMMYLVHVAIAAFFLGATWTWITLAISIFCFIALFIWHVPFAALQGHSHQDIGSAGFNLHLHGMLLAFILIGSLLAFFITKMAKELEAFRERRFQENKLTALASLAAGAAHELASPLGTAYLIAEEMNAHPLTNDAISVSKVDVEELHNELKRARDVLSQMRAKSPELQGEALREIYLGELLARVISRLSPNHQSQLKVIGLEQQEIITSLPISLEESLFVLIKNAFESSPEGGLVTVEIRKKNSNIEFLVSDHGKGVSDENLLRLGDPFFTTKSVTHGMGLGLFLVKTFARQVRGHLSFLQLKPGFQACLSLPL